MELRGAAGRGASAADSADDELKMMALAGLVHSDPEGALPRIEKILAGDGSTELKEQALFLAGQTGSEAGAELLLSVARDASDPELQQSAIQYLGVLGGEDQIPLLSDLYREIEGREARESILHAFMVAGAREQLLDAARGESDPELRESAIQLLGTQNASDELWALFEAKTSLEVRESILDALMIGGDSQRLLAVAGDAGLDEELRGQAIQLLGVHSYHRELESLLATVGSPDLEEEVVQALSIGGRSEALERIAADPGQRLELRQEAVQMLGVHGGGNFLWRLFESETSADLRGEILEGIALAGDEEHLLAVARDPAYDAEIRDEAFDAMVITGAAAGLVRSLYDQLTERELKEKALELLFISGAAEELAAIVRQESDRELRAEAVQYLGMTGSPAAREIFEEMLDQ